MQKAELRKKALALRSLEDKSKSKIICKALIALLEFQKAQNIMLYMPVRDEVDTTDILLTAKKLGKKVYAPVVIDSERMEAREITENGFKKGAFGVLEPLGKPSENFDLIVVPVVAADKALHRIGYGKGYYDRFLRDKSGVKIALAYECQVFNDIKSEEHDVALDYIITEKEIYR